MSVVNIMSQVQRGGSGDMATRAQANGGEGMMSTPIAPHLKGDSVGIVKDASVARQSNLSNADLEAIVEEIQSNLDFMNTKIAFKVDKKSEEMVVEVMDKETGEVLKQIPPEEILKIRAAFKDLVRGMLVNAQA